MSDRDDPGVAPGYVLARRLVLSVGGISLLAGCISQLQRTANVSQNAKLRSHPVTDSAASASRPRRGVFGQTTSTPTGAHAGAPRTGAPNAGTGGRHASDGGPMYTVHDGDKAIALTIDDGPSALYTPQVLRLLARYKVTATFSMIGIQVAAEPAIAREVVAAGHLVSNHTYRHLNLGWLAPSAVQFEMDRATEAIHTATGVTPAMFRAPYGVWSATVLRRCQQTGMTPIDWSVDPRDWSRPGVSAIVANIMRNTKTGSIILEHDGGGDRSETVAALGVVIPLLLDHGYHFVTPLFTVFFWGVKTTPPRPPLRAVVARRYGLARPGGPYGTSAAERPRSSLALAAGGRCGRWDAVVGVKERGVCFRSRASRSRKGLTAFGRLRCHGGVAVCPGLQPPGPLWWVG